MSIKRLQNRIAESRLALPITSVYTVLVWIAGGLFTQQLWWQFACLVISTYLMLELNNVNALIRTYSRMVSCSFLFLCCALAFPNPTIGKSVVVLCMIAFYSTFFRSYQNKKSMGWIFYSFFFIGLASLFFIQILYFVPVLLILLASNLMAGSVKNVMASLVGLTAVYWFYGAYCMLQGEYRDFISHFESIAEFQPLFVHDMLSEHQIVSFSLILLLSVIGTIHYLRTSYADKIRPRMLYELMIAVNTLCIIFIVLQPMHCDMLVSIMTVSTSVLTAHFITLTHTRITNISFFVLLVITLLITAYNIWIPSLIS